MIVHECAQGTTLWLELRKGIPTASLFDNIMTAGMKKSESQEAYLHHLLAERVLGKVIDGFKSQWMAHGNDYEDSAVAAYELSHNVNTRKIGFVVTDDGLVGCSPDRFIDEEPDGGVEAKAPSPAVHISYLLASIGASKKFKVQLQGQCWVCEKEWIDIISYCPGFPDAVFRTYRDEVFIKELAAHVRAFSGRLEELANQFKEKGWIRDKATLEVEDTSVHPSFLTQEDTDFILRQHFPQMYEQSSLI